MLLTCVCANASECECLWMTIDVQYVISPPLVERNQNITWERKYSNYLKKIYVKSRMIGSKGNLWWIYTIPFIEFGLSKWWRNFFILFQQIEIGLSYVGNLFYFLSQKEICLTLAQSEQGLDKICLYSTRWSTTHSIQEISVWEAQDIPASPRTIFKRFDAFTLTFWTFVVTTLFVIQATEADGGMT